MTFYVFWVAADVFSNTATSCTIDDAVLYQKLLKSSELIHTVLKRVHSEVIAGLIKLDVGIWAFTESNLKRQLWNFKC